MIHTYQTADIVSCLGDRELLFVGDCTVRQIFWVFARKLDQRKAEDWGYGGTQHSDLDFPGNGVRLKFLWDPFINKSETRALLVQQRAVSYADIAIRGKVELPALVILGGGLWYAKGLEFENATREYELAMKGAISSLQDRYRSGADYTSIQPGNDFHAIVPVQNVLHSNLKLDKRITSAKVDRMNELLRGVALRTHSLVIWSMNQLSCETAEDYIWDGIHNSDNIAEQKANILLNLRCNSILMQKVQYPKGKICCAIYPPDKSVPGRIS